jgi:hypothetical protein
MEELEYGGIMERLKNLDTRFVLDGHAPAPRVVKPRS